MKICTLHTVIGPLSTPLTRTLGKRVKVYLKHRYNSYFCASLFSIIILYRLATSSNICLLLNICDIIYNIIVDRLYTSGIEDKQKILLPYENRTWEKPSALERILSLLVALINARKISNKLKRVYPNGYVLTMF